MFWRGESLFGSSQGEGEVALEVSRVIVVMGCML